MTPRVALVAALAATVFAAFAARASEPSTSRSERTPSRASSAAECGRCHEHVYAAWRTSRHAASWSNDLFARDFERHPQGWCLGCHVPRAEQRAALLAGDRGPANDGVDCAACHVDPADGALVTSRAPSEKTRAAHPGIRHDATLGESSGCARCHQFLLPGTAIPMQNTLEEWRGTPDAAAGVECHACHMPRGRSHAFPGAHDRDLLRAAVEITLRREGASTIATLRSRATAHALPTGDVFRSLVLRLCADEACTQVNATERLGRWMVALDKSFVVADRAIPPPRTGQPAERTLTLDATGSHYRLSFAYSGDALPAEELVLSEGPIPP